MAISARTWRICRLGGSSGDLAISSGEISPSSARGFEGRYADIESPAEELHGGLLGGELTCLGGHDV